MLRKNWSRQKPWSRFMEQRKLEKKCPLLCQILGTHCVVLWSFFAPVKPRLVSAIFGNYYYYYFFFSASSEAVTAFNQSGANELFSARPALNLHSRSSAEKWKVTDKWPPRSTSLSSRFSSRAGLFEQMDFNSGQAAFLSTFRVRKSCYVIWDYFSCAPSKPLWSFYLPREKSRSLKQRKENNPLSLKARQA